MKKLCKKRRMQSRTAGTKVCVRAREALRHEGVSRSYADASHKATNPSVQVADPHAEWLVGEAASHDACAVVSGTTPSKPRWEPILAPTAGARTSDTPESRAQLKLGPLRASRCFCFSGSPTSRLPVT